MAKHVPIRKCVGCQKRRPKQELIRIVRNKEGQVSLDKTGKKPGRGAYICPEIDCLEKAFQKNRLEKVLRGPIGEEVKAVLREEIENEKG